MSFAPAKKLLVLMLGPSGSGLSSGIHSLEDLGFRCVDNLPLHLLPLVLDDLIKCSGKNAFGFAVRFEETKDVEIFDQITETLRKKVELEILFLSCRDDELLKRYITSRRKHPYFDKQRDLLLAIKEEKKALLPLMEKASAAFDTTGISPIALKGFIESRYFLDAEQRRKLAIKIVSFGFKHGAPELLDTLYDVRFLSNPYFHSGLREKNGRDEEIKEYLLNHQLTKPYLEKLFDWHTWLLPEYYREGRHYFNIGIGCTGGQHRSVFVAEALFTHLKKNLHQLAYLSLEHRDMK